MSKTVETMLAWGLFAAVYALILAIVLAPEMFSPKTEPQVTMLSNVTTADLGVRSVVSGPRIPQPQ